ncbi:DUF2871 domain-containing protein [Cellulosilyticum lentocellum]|uniref:DUF2871 domain-containing protein n=1 Tax=Cellulosilyticum lentocellum (strain ATCC 49066 / DSM 5427 / NCIMB 11756 / RHM5) TaxID=642492 RepID=F2JJF8_CELLD|nr:DUF2871 domain-containing protein [Cellulosilyticum lentocellum]ADZ85553.1 Protein of unknown function DUF2871 [Cellulosilyticum lentocellum DSM 5427]
MKKYFYASFTYLILGLIAGIFYRELTKMSNFTGETVLSGVHTHLLVLGFIFFLVILLLDKSFQLSQLRSVKAWFVTYQVGLVTMTATMVARGVAQVKGFDIAGLNHMAGLSHTLLAIALIWLMVLLGKAIKTEK